MPAIAEETGLELVRLEMPSEVHKQFRVEAAKEGLSMAAMARRLVEEWTAKRNAGGK
jgi:plasmid stability protein